VKLAALASSAPVHACGWMLLHFVWQGTLIAAVLWLALASLPRAHARARYAACCAALLGLGLAPAITLWRLLRLAPEPRALLARSLEVPPGAGGYFFLWLLGAWLSGSAVMTARLAVGVAQLRRLVQRAEAPPSGWQQRLAALALRLGVRQRVQLLVSDQVDAPLVLGWLRPVILAPLAAFTALPPQSLEALLAHELGHVRRCDYLFNVLQSCLEAALFYHPAVHWVSRSLRFEREHCCDDIAIQGTGDPLQYARALSAMESLRVHIPEPALAATGGSLMLRIERILRRPSSRSAPARVALTASVLLALGSGIAGVWACSAAASDPADTSLAAAPLEHAPLEHAPAPGRASPGGALGIDWLPEVLEPWKPALSESAQRYGLDPALLAIVTLVESSGDPAARSPRGALGLMQLMPATAARIAAERQLSGYSDERLLEPAYNIDFGAWYLSRQLADLGARGLAARSVELAAVAYNAGPRALRAYLESGAALPAETERYRDLVVGMWNERHEPESATYAAWREQSNQ
jgi:soluble lytic murein transglycosylase-like protein/Zn-dependent protease with chaperone function